MSATCARIYDVSAQTSACLQDGQTNKDCCPSVGFSGKSPHCDMVALNYGKGFSRFLLCQRRSTVWSPLQECFRSNQRKNPDETTCCCCCRPHSTNVLPAESSTRIMWQPTVSPPRWQGKAPLCRDSSRGPG